MTAVVSFLGVKPLRMTWLLLSAGFDTEKIYCVKFLFCDDVNAILWTSFTLWNNAILWTSFTLWNNAILWV